MLFKTDNNELYGFKSNFGKVDVVLFSMRDEGYTRLGFAIVESAVNDYKKAAAKLIKNHSNKNAYDEIIELEAFFHSNWCDTLLQDKLSGEYILKNLRKEYGDELFYTEKEGLSESSSKAKKKSKSNVRKSRRI